MDAGSDHPLDHTDVTVDQAAEVFRDLGDPTRVGIIAELVSAHRAGETPLTFGSLRQRLDIADSGRFNYHLDQLQPRFVQSVEGGYEPRYAATLAQSLLEGVGTAEPESLEGTADRPCVLCEEQPVVRYVPDRLTVRCETYGEQLIGMPIPPAIAEDRSLEAILEFAERYGEHQLSLAMDGVCSYCWGPIESEFSSTDTFDNSSALPSVLVECACRDCEHAFTMVARNVAYEHPAVAGFHYEHGVDLSEGGLLDRFAELHVVSATLSDGLATLVFELEGDRLAVVIDGDLEVLEVTAAD